MSTSAFPGLSSWLEVAAALASSQACVNACVSWDSCASVGEAGRAASNANALCLA